MKATLQPYNPFDNALTVDDIPWFLTEAYQDEDPSVFVTALGHVVKHKGVAQLAQQTGLNRESLYKAFNGKVQPRWDTIHRLLRALDVTIEIAA